MFLLGGKILQIDTPFNHRGIQYPANWLRLSTSVDKEAIGIVEVPDPVTVDDRLYYIDSKGTVVPKNIDTVKQTLLYQITSTASSMLSRTDWYFIRKLDIGKEIPNHITSYRNSVRQTFSQIENNINMSTTIEELQVIANNISNQWPILEDKGD